MEMLKEWKWLLLDGTDVKLCVYISLLLVALETHFSLIHGWADSYGAPQLFLWTERLIVLYFTFCAASWAAKSRGILPSLWYGGCFLWLTAMVPFWVGFFVPPEWLGVIRALRVLRVGLLLMMNVNAQYLALTYMVAVRKSWDTLKVLVFLFLFFGVLFVEIEKNAQPEAFKDFVDVMWFAVITGTTVGYGDVYPATELGRLFTMTMLIPLIGSLGIIFGMFSEASAQIAEARRKGASPYWIYVYGKPFREGENE